jgi:putative ABC transport system permease protein
LVNFILALKLLWRDWRAGELTLLLASLVIAVGTVTTITLFIDRLQQALITESASFLAADRVVSGAKPVPDEWLAQATELGLEQAEHLSFLSMVFSEERAQFSSVKAVSPGYPLRGKLIISDTPFVGGAVIRNGPSVGNVWLESRLMASLDLAVGDQLDVGSASFVVSRVLIKEPDRGGGFNNLGPRVMMNLEDVPLTKVVQPGSRLTYRYLFAGEQSNLEEFEAWLKPRLGQDYRQYGVKQGTQGIGRTLERAEQFMLLGGLLGVILAGVAIALSAQRYSLRHFDHVAIMKSLGATSARIDLLYSFVFVVIGTLATVIGCGLGWITQLGVVKLLAPYIPVVLPDPGLRPFAVGGITGFVCLLAFALPPILKLRAISPIRVLRRDLGTQKMQDRVTWIFGICGSWSLMWWYSQDVKLTMLIFAGGAFSVLLLGVVAWALLRSGRVLGMQAGSIWRLALAGMQRRGQENTLQILVFGLAIMLLLILVLVRTALIDEWKAQIPDKAPNHFVINIAPEEVAPINEMISGYQLTSQPLYPMISGKIIEVNGKSSAELDAVREAQRGQQSAPRAGSNRNLTWIQSLPEENQIVAGEWWADDYQGEALVSIERDLASSNGFKVGDQLKFMIRDSELNARVASIRSVKWDNMKPNFYIIFSPGALNDFPSTYITSFFLEKHQKLFLNKLLKEYPTITVLEVDAIIEQIQTIINQVTLAIELVLSLIIVSGGLVLLASIQASMDERFHQHAILRTLGASQKLVLGSLLVEFSVLGFFAGILATIGAEVTVYGLETEIFELEYTSHPWLWLLGPLVGTLMIGILGTLATRRVVQIPPITILRELA